MRAPAPDDIAPRDDHDLGDDLDRRRARWLVVVIGIAMLVGIGGPVVGQGVFHGADVVMEYAPWSHGAPVGFEHGNSEVGDTVNAALPGRLEIRERLLDGELPLWTRDQGSGVPLMAVPDLSTLSPVLLPYWVLPGWYAPAASKLLEMAITAIFTALFARRLGTSRVAALLGGAVFAFSGFQVVWTNWPQTTVGAFIPMLFWAVERAVQERTLRSAVPVALATAFLLFGGFPAVAAFALLAAGVHALVRVLAQRSEPLPPRLVTLGVLGGMVALGVALAAVQLVPFLDHLAQLDTEYRAQNGDSHLPLEALATLAVPFTFGPSTFGPYWGPKNMVEINSFIGVVATALVVVAAARGRRLALPAGAAGSLWGLTGASVVLVYLGGLPLVLLQRALPFLFGSNAVGRLRSVLGLLLATLAAIGLDALLRREPGRPTRRELVAALTTVAGGLVVYGLAVRYSVVSEPVLEVNPAVASVLPWVWPALLGLTAVSALGLWLLGSPQRRAAALAAVAGTSLVLTIVVATGVVGTYPAVAARSVLAPLVVAIAVGVVVWRHVTVGDRRLVVVALPLLVALEVVAFANPYWARSTREHFYPVTETHEFLAANTDQSRVALSDRTMQPGTTSMYGIPSVTAHMFFSPAWRDLILEVDPTAFEKDTFPFLHVQRDDLDGVADHPVLDRLSARYFVADLALPVLGTRTDPPSPDGELPLRPDEPVLGTVPGDDLRGVRVAVLPPGHSGPADQPAWLRVDVLDADGQVVTSASRRVETLTERDNVTVPLPQVDLPGEVTVRLQLEPTGAGSLVLGAVGDDPALGHVTASGAEDVRPVFVDGAVVYEQQGWLPRVRWASSTEVLPDATARLARLGSDDLPDETVVLSAPGPDAAGGPADVTVVEETGDGLVVEVDAEGAGYVVVADGLHYGWQATVDGEPAEVREADHALGAVAVPAGQHTVRITFAPTALRLGTGVSVAALLALVAALLVTQRRGRQPGSV